MRPILHAAAISAAALSALLCNLPDARAQEAAAEPATEDALAEEASAAEEPAGPSAASAPADPTASTAIPPADAELKWGRWTERFIDRPRTLPRGMIEAGGYLDLERYGIDPGTGDDDGATLTHLVIAGGYGITDRLEARLSYGLYVDEFEERGPLSLGAAYAFEDGRFALAASGDFVYDFLYEVGEIGLGARARYKLTPSLALYTFRQLEVTVIADGTQPASLHLPLGVGYQVTDKIYLFAETELASISLKDSTTLAIFDDYLQLNAGGVFAISEKLEVGASFYTDFKDERYELLVFGVFGRVYL